MSRRAPVIGFNGNFRYGQPAAPQRPRWQRADLFEVQARYAWAIAQAGGTPLLVPAFADSALLRPYLELVDGFLFIGGSDLPPELYGAARAPEVTQVITDERCATDLFLCGELRQGTRPLLGICLGCQLLNVSAGGKLVQHLAVTAAHRGEKGDLMHAVEIAPESLLARILGPGRHTVNSCHHQAVDPAAVAGPFRVSARAADGTIEAIEDPDKPFCLGVQWHPERIDDAGHQAQLFGAFIDACRRCC